MTKDFEAYAEREYLGAVCRTDEDADLQLAGVRFVATRAVAEQEGCLRELLDMRSANRTRREVDAGLLCSVKLEDANWFRPLGIVHKRHKTLSTAAEKFVEHLHEDPATFYENEKHSATGCSDANGTNRAANRKKSSKPRSPAGRG